MNMNVQTESLLLSQHDIACEVTLGEVVQKQQQYTVAFESPSQKLRWAVDHKWVRFRQLAAVIKLTCAARELSNSDFAALEKSHAPSSFSWLGSGQVRKQEERRRQLEVWLCDVVGKTHLLSLAAKGDLVDFWTNSTTGTNPEPSPRSSLPVVAMQGIRGGSNNEGEGDDVADRKYSQTSPYRIYTRRDSTLPAVKAKADGALEKVDALTAIIYKIRSYLTLTVVPDRARVVTAVTCISRTGEVTTQSVASVLGDVLAAGLQQAQDLLPSVLILLPMARSLCQHETATCAGFAPPERRVWAVQLLFFSALLYVALRWRHGMQRHAQRLEAAQHASSRAQEHLQAFLADATVVYSVEPSQHVRYEPGNSPASPIRSPYARKSRSATLLPATDLSNSTFDAFDLPDVTPEDRAHWWDAANSHHFQVRGPSYKDDGAKEHPGPALCKLMLLEIYEVEEGGDRHDHVCSMGLARKRIDAISSLPGAPFVFVVNFQIPGDPPVSLVAFFALPPNMLERSPSSATTKFADLFKTFTALPDERERLAAWGIAPPAEHKGETDDGSDEGAAKSAARPQSGNWLKVSDIQWPAPECPGAFPPEDFRHQRLKLICNITDGPWVVKAAVPARPAVLGNKVVTRYFGGPGYLEVDIHVGSSIIACQVTSLCRSFVKFFAADLAIVIQGENEGELPERVLGCAHIHKLDLSLRRSLYEEVEEDVDL